MAKKAESGSPPPKKQECPPCEEGLPAWLATFADLVTLLMCFFVLLLSFANQDITKFRTLMGSVRDAFGVQLKRKGEFAPMAPSPNELREKDVKTTQDEKMLIGMTIELKNVVLENKDLKESAVITPEHNGVVMRLPTHLLFKPNTAKLKASSKPIMTSIIKLLKEHNFDLVVRGHTDDSFDPSGQFPSNWELSSSRAAAALRYIHLTGDISAARLKAVGYADSRPIFPNTRPENRKHNNRMEFYFHRPSLDSW